MTFLLKPHFQLWSSDLKRVDFVQSLDFFKRRKFRFLLRELYLFLIISVGFWLSSTIKIFYFGFPSQATMEEYGGEGGNTWPW